MHVLVVDDNEVARSIVETTLTVAGYDVQTAADGREALNIIRQGSCRMVVSDWSMPRMNGIELCRAIRAENLPGYVYIILLTARHTPTEKVQGLSAGADDFIVKPFDPPELLARIRIGERILAIETREMAIFAMAKLAESRDPETGAHLERVRSYARVITEYLATLPKYAEYIDAEYIRLIYLTSPLHDIGKVGLPDSVLLKPGRLTQEEFDVMKTHTTIGAETLDAAIQRYPGVRFLEMARAIVLSHHERYDGTGYPMGLAGEEIPLAGRIVALADVYDALTSKRVYKEAFPHEHARGIILEEDGGHFDPDVVEAFRCEEKEFLRISHLFVEEQQPAAATDAKQERISA